MIEQLRCRKNMLVEIHTPPQKRQCRGDQNSMDVCSESRTRVYVHDAASIRLLVDLFLLVDAVLAGAAVDQEEKSPNYGQDLEEIVFGKVLVRVVLVQLMHS